MTTMSRFLPQTTGAGSVSEPKIVAVDTTACPSTLFVSRSIRCVSDHMVIANAQHLTFRYSHFRYYIPLTALTTVLSRLQHMLVDIHTQQHTPPQGVHPNRMGSSLMHSSRGRETFGLSLVPPPETTTRPAHTQDSYCSLIREIVIITKEYNKNINNSLGVGVVIRGCPQDSNAKVCSTHIALFATRERSEAGYCSAYSNPPPLLTHITEENI